MLSDQEEKWLPNEISWMLSKRSLGKVQSSRVRHFTLSTIRWMSDRGYRYSSICDDICDERLGSDLAVLRWCAHGLVAVNDYYRKSDLNDTLSRHEHGLN